MTGVARYKEADSVFHALSVVVGGYHPVRLVRMSWLFQQEGGRLQRRQVLPPEAFIDVEELCEVWRAGGCGGRDKVLPIISVSFCWDSPEDPDPDGIQLSQVVRALRNQAQLYQMADRSFKGFAEMGVFWDFVSLLQADYDRRRAKEQALREEGWSDEDAFTGSWKAIRTADEQAAFGFALEKTMDLWYSHAGIAVLLLTQHPRERGSTRTEGYEDSGWPTFERCSAELGKPAWRYDSRWHSVADLGAGEVAAAGRRWPTGPDDFDQLVANKVFKNGADEQAVKRVFRRQSEAMLSSLCDLDFGRDGIPHLMDTTPHDAARLGGCLLHCRQARSLRLNRVGLTGEGLGLLCARLHMQQALTLLTVLTLSDNSLGDDGMEVLSRAVGQGSFAALEALDVRSNRIGDAGARAVGVAGEAGAFATLEKLQLYDNLVGDEGARALANSVAAGGLGSLQELGLTANSVGDAGAEALAGAVKAGHLRGTVNLCRNLVGKPGKDAFISAGLGEDLCDGRAGRPPA